MILVISYIATLPFFGNVAISQSQEFKYAFANISANIVIPIQAEEYSKLSFGKFSPGNGGSIIISPDGTVKTTSTVILKDGTSTPGNFVVSGEIAATVAVSIPNISTLTNENQQSMIVDNWSIDREKNIRLNDGSQSISVGATLNVGSMDQNPKGIYTGTYQIVFSYN